MEKRPPDFYCSSRKSEIIGNKIFVLNTWEKAESFEIYELIKLLARMLVKEASIHRVSSVYLVALQQSSLVIFASYQTTFSDIHKTTNFHTPLNNCCLIKFFLSKKLWCVCVHMHVAYIKHNMNSTLAFLAILH